MNFEFLPTFAAFESLSGSYDRSAFEVSEAARVTYEEIFEQDARWMLGKQLLADIVAHVRGKPLLAIIDDSDPSRININIPMPTIVDEISGKKISILYMVPPELIDILSGRLTEAMSAYLGNDGKRMIESFLNSPTEQYVVSAIQAELSLIEQTRRSAGDGELWQVVASYVGLSTNPIASLISVSYSTQKSG